MVNITDKTKYLFANCKFRRSKHENYSFSTEQLHDDAERFETGIDHGVEENENDDSSRLFSKNSTNFSGLTTFNRTRWSCILKTSRSHLDNFGGLLS